MYRRSPALLQRGNHLEVTFLSATHLVRATAQRDHTRNNAMHIDLGPKFRDRIITKYPALETSDIPIDRKVTPIDHKRDDVQKYHVIFWHRLLKRIYEGPLEIECELHSGSHKKRVNTDTAIFRKTPSKNRWEVLGGDEAFAAKIEGGQVKPFPVNWKYLIKLPSGGIVELGTRDKNTAFYIAQVSRSESTQREDSDEANTYINILLAEANRLRNDLFKPEREFEKRDDLKSYYVFNVYRANYLSALAMLRIAESGETTLRQEGLRYDARTSDLQDKKKRAHIDDSMLKCGMFYCSTVTYFFMALEGFVNLIFHVFLKNEFRHEAPSMEQRFDLGQKLTFMTSLCDGFKENSPVSSTIISDFKKLQKYRNSLFHSKVEDSLKSLSFVEDGFIYTYDIKDTFLPSRKAELTLQDVNSFHKLVDKITDEILNSMNRDTRVLTNNCIMKEAFIPIRVLETGELALLTNRRSISPKQHNRRQ